MLSGKNKIQFEEHYLIESRKQRQDYNKYSDEVLLRKFYRKTLSEKYGIYVDYFDSVGVYIQSKFRSFRVSIGSEVYSGLHLTRNEARKQAIEKANEIINNR